MGTANEAETSVAADRIELLRRTALLLETEVQPLGQPELL
jgi:hypothetical protein